MKYYYILLLLVSFSSKLRAQTLQDKELNRYYSANEFFNKKSLEIPNLILIGDFGDTKIFNLKTDNEYFGTLKLNSKPKYFFYKELLHQIIYYVNIPDLKNNVDYISKLFYGPNGYSEVYPTLIKKETEKKYFWKGFYMLIEVNEGEISFIDRRVEGKAEIGDYEYWRSKGY